jgi:hypothetical protein
MAAQDFHTYGALPVGALGFGGSTGMLEGDPLLTYVAGTLALPAIATTGNAAVAGNAAVVGSTQLTGALTLLNSLIPTGPNGEAATLSWVEELLTLSTSGATTDTAANLLPANALILAVVARVTTSITTATDWKLSDPTTAGRFSAANSTMTAGATIIGILQWSGAVTTLAAGPSQPAAAKARITTTGTPGAGAVRIGVLALTFGAPTA